MREEAAEVEAELKKDEVCKKTTTTTGDKLIIPPLVKATAKDKFCTHLINSLNLENTSSEEESTCEIRPTRYLESNELECMVNKSINRKAIEFVQDVNPDGNCGFRVIAQDVKNNEND
ncbi:hypothetical protein ABG067_008347 [Albugo candida]